MAVSTAPTPLDESLTKFLGGSGASSLSPNQVTYGSTVPSSGIGYDPNNQFRPQGDILTINAEPGTGATTSETWSHELELERQKQDALEFEFQQQQEANRQAEEAAALEIARAEEARQSGMYGYETESAKLANQAASYQNAMSAYDLLEAQRAEERYQGSLATIAANDAYSQFRGGAPISGDTQAAYQAVQAATPQPWWGSFEYNTNRGVSTPQTYSVPLGINGKPTQQIYPGR